MGVRLGNAGWGKHEQRPHATCSEEALFCKNATGRQQHTHARQASPKSTLTAHAGQRTYTIEGNLPRRA